MVGLGDTWGCCFNSVQSSQAYATHTHTHTTCSHTQPHLHHALGPGGISQGGGDPGGVSSNEGCTSQPWLMAQKGKTLSKVTQPVRASQGQAGDTPTPCQDSQLTFPAVPQASAPLLPSLVPPEVCAEAICGTGCSWDGPFPRTPPRLWLPSLAP